MSRVSAEHHPGIDYLLKPGEDPQMLAKMNPEQLLNRWLGYHLTHRGKGPDDGSVPKDLKV